MALDIDALQFQEPLPGMSLTTEPKGRPWERPAKYSNPDDAVDFYIQQLADPKRIAQALEILELGYPLASLVDSLIMNGVMQGLHSIDTAIIVAPAIFELLQGIADHVGISYEIEQAASLMSKPVKIKAPKQEIEEIE